MNIKPDHIDVQNYICVSDKFKTDQDSHATTDSSLKKEDLVHAIPLMEEMEERDNFTDVHLVSGSFNFQLNPSNRSKYERRVCAFILCVYLVYIIVRVNEMLLLPSLSFIINMQPKAKWIYMREKERESLFILDIFERYKISYGGKI